MSDLEKQLLNSAQDGAEGSSSSVGSHLLAKLAEGNADSKLVTKEIRQKMVRGGRGSEGEPVEIKKSIDKAREEEVRIDHDLAKIKNDKDGLLFAIADLRIKERQAVEGRLSSFTIEKIRKELAEAQGKIEKINGVLPESEAVKDHKQIQSIMSEWYGGKRNWKKESERFKKAEKILETKPRDMESLREANSARAEMKATEERLEKTAEEAKRIAENADPNSVRNMSIRHTNDETVNEKNYLSKRRTERVSTNTIKAPEQQQGEPVTINETSVEEKNTKQELPPLEFTLETTNDDSGMENEEKKPLQSAYDTAMDRLWKENEAKRNAVLGNIPESDIEHDIETHNAILPITTEGAEGIVGTPAEGQEAAFEKFENIAEKKAVTKEGVLNTIALMRENVEAEAEKKKVPEGWLRRVGDTWNKVPTRYKLLLTAGMVASGLGSAFIGATTAVGTIATIGAGLRAVGGAGLFVAIENGLKNRAEKKGKRSGFEELRDTTLAATLSIIIVGVLPNMARDYAVEHGLFQKISEFFSFGDKPTEVSVETATYVETAKEGDSIWKMAEHQLEAHYGEKFTSLSPEKQTYLIDAVKDKITLGMNEETANTLAIGQSMDFKHVFTDKDFMNGMFTNAQNLTPEQISNIQNYDASASVETPARSVSVEEFLNEPLHTTFTPEEASGIIPAQIIPTPEQTVLPVESNTSHANAIVEMEGLKGIFQYSQNGSVESFSMEGSSTATDGQKLLNENWREVVRNNPGVGGENMSINAVNANATTVSMYEQMLDTLEKKGAGATHEADFLRSSIENTVTEAERMYGDVFKNIEDFGTLEETVPAEITPEEILPEEPKDVLMENYIPPMPTEITDNPQALVFAKEQVREIIKEVFGKEGWFLGLGSSDGTEVYKNFADKTVEEVMSANASEMQTNDTLKMQDLLNQAREQTHVNSLPGEKVSDYLYRATAINIDRFMKNG